MRPSWGFATSGPKAVSGIFTEGAIESWAHDATLVFSLPLLNQKFPKDRLRWFQKPKIGSAVRADMDLEVGSVESSQKFGTPPPKNFRPDCFIGFRDLDHFRQVVPWDASF